MYSSSLGIVVCVIVILYLFVEHRLLPPDPRQDLCDQYRQQCNQDTECYRHLQPWMEIQVILKRSQPSNDDPLYYIDCCKVFSTETDDGIDPPAEFFVDIMKNGQFEDNNNRIVHEIEKHLPVKNIFTNRIEQSFINPVMRA